MTKEIEKGTNVYSVNIETNLSVVKLLHAKWLISFYDQMQNNREEIITKALKFEANFVRTRILKGKSYYPNTDAFLNFTQT